MSDKAPEIRPAGFGLRIAAVFYDSLLLLAALVVTVMLLTAATSHETLQAQPLWYQTTLLLIIFAFLGGFWMKGGQTLGMLAWRLKVRMKGGGPIPLHVAVLRFGVAIVSWLAFGLGFVWILIDKEKRAWHDIVAQTEIVQLPKKKD